MRQFSFHHFSPQKILLAFVFMHMTPINASQATEREQKDILLEDHKFSHPHFNNDSAFMSASAIESLNSHEAFYPPYGPLSMSLSDSMVPPSSSTSYHWRELEYLWSLISNTIPNLSLSRFSYFSNQLLDGMPSLSHLNESSLPSNSPTSLIDLSDSYFGFHYLEDTTDETNTKT